MKINGNVALSIVKKLDALQSYSVNIVDRDGTIVGSSESWRVGRFHPGALKRMENYEKYGDALATPGGLTFSNNPEKINGMRCLKIRNRIVGAVELIDIKPQDLAFTVVAKAIAELMLEHELALQDVTRKKASVSETLTALVGNHPADPSQLLSDLRAHGIDPEVPRTAIFIRLSKRETIQPASGSVGTRELRLDPKQVQFSVKQLLELLPYTFSFENDLILPDALHTNALILCADRAPEPELNEMRLLDMCRHLETVALSEYSLILRAIVGSRCLCFSDYDRQYEQLVNRMASGHLLYPDQNILLGNSIVLGNFITYTSRQTRQNVVSYVYDKLLRSSQREVLLDTLSMFFACDLNATLTAERLYVHRNTLQARIKRVEQLTGHSMDKTVGLLTLRLALVCYNSLLAEEQAL